MTTRHAMAESGFFWDFCSLGPFTDGCLRERSTPSATARSLASKIHRESQIKMTTFLIALALHSSFRRAAKLAPVPINSLLRSAELIVRVKPTTDPYHLAVRDIIWSSVGSPGKYIELAPVDERVGPETLPNPEVLANRVRGNDSIVFLHRLSKGTGLPGKMDGAEVLITLESSGCTCTEEPLMFGGPQVLFIGDEYPPVYFPLPFKKKRRNWVTYAELKAAIITLNRRIHPGK